MPRDCEFQVAELSRRHAKHEDLKAYADQLAADLDLEMFTKLGEGLKLEDKGVDALGLLERWVLDAEAQPFCAVLGEYGMGKTTLLKAFTQKLLEERKSRPELPLPIFVDLKLFVDSGSQRKVPTLEEILREVVRRVHPVDADYPPVEPREIVRLVKEEGALIIFDGLDEKIVHLSTADAGNFIRELWKVLPVDSRSGDTLVADESRESPPATGVSPLLESVGGDVAPPKRGRLIISCRSHYFQDVWNQQAMLTGNDRAPVKAKHYKAVVMLPFGDGQITSYITQVFGKERTESIRELMEEVHNLSELAQRPYLLSVIAENVERLETLRARGQTVSAVTLYDLIVKRWLLRDDGKHTFSPSDKVRLMEDLAAAMWKSEAREWKWERLERWMREYLVSDPVFASRYEGDKRDRLEEDLRTATFVLRRDDSEESFLFAHRSLQEYFLACALMRCLNDGVLEGWDIADVSRETLDFFLQLVAQHVEESPKDSTWRTKWNALLETYRPHGSLLALRAWLMARDVVRQNLASVEPNPGKVSLPGEDLREFRISGAAGARFPLAGADLRGAELSQMRLEHVDLSGVDLSGARCWRTEFIDSNLSGASVENAELAGSAWRRCAVKGLRDAGANWYGVRWMDNDVELDAVSPHASQSPSHLVTRSPSHPVTAATAAWGHGDSVTSCAWNREGTRLASASYDKTVRIWDAHSGACLAVLEGHGGLLGAVSSCAWNREGTRLASASWDKTVRIWDAQSGACLAVLEDHDGGVTSCAWNRKGTRLVSASDDNTVRIWDAQSGAGLAVLEGHGDMVTSCAWNREGSRLASASTDRTLRVWDVASGAGLAVLEGHGGAVRSCAWNREGSRLASASDDRTLRIWDAQSGACLAVLDDHDGGVTSCAWNREGTRLASASDDGTVRIWDAQSGACLVVLEGHGDAVSSCAWNREGLASASGDKTVRIWDAQSGACLAVLGGHGGLFGGVTSCAWNREGTRLASASGDKTVRIWDAQSGACLAVLEGHGGAVTSCAWNREGTRLASASWEKPVRIWDAQSGACLAVLEGHGDAVSSCAWNREGTLLASASWENTVRIWDAQSGACLAVLDDHDGGVTSCAWNREGTRLASASDDNTVRIWDAQSGACLAVLEGHCDGIFDTVTSCAWNREGSRLASASTDRTLRIWDAASGAGLAVLEGHGGGVTSCAWNREGTRLASASSDRTVRIWDAQSGAGLAELEGHDGGVRSCAWNREGTRLASASSDGSVRIWDAETFECLAVWYHGPDGDWASVNGDHSEILHASEGAWRFINWRGWDEEAKEWRFAMPEVPC